METQRQRRALDQQDEIERLIASEQDPQSRLHLMILNRINLALVANTTATMEIHDKLTSHLVHYDSFVKNADALLNKGKGGWYILGWAFGVANMVIGWIVVDVNDKQTTIRDTVYANTLVIQKLNSKIEAIEKE